jgi:hypothetical protein
MTPKETKLFVDALNKEFKKDRKNFRWESSDFYNQKIKLPDGTETQQRNPYTADDVRKKLNPEQQKIFDETQKKLGPKFGTFLEQFVRYGSVDDKPSKEAFVSVKSPKTKEKTINVYDWEFEEMGIPKKLAKDSNNLLKKMSAKERNAFISKLNFPAKWKTYEDKSGSTLAVDVPLKPKYYNLTFKTDSFLASANNLLAREGKMVDKADLMEKLEEYFNEIGKREYDYYSSEDYVKETYGDYLAEDVKSKGIDGILKDGDLEDDIVNYIKKLQQLEVDDDDIIKDLIESGEDVVKDSHYRTDNAIGYSSSPSEEEIQFGEGSIEFDEEGFPYPKDLDANLSLLNEEDIEKLRRSISEIYMKFKKDETTGGWRADYGTIGMGDSRGIELVVDPAEFISRAKRRIKDLKLKGRKLPKEEKESENSMDQYPTVTHLLASEDAEGANIAPRGEAIPPATKRNMIAVLYEGIARNILPMPEDRIAWMVDYIHTKMTDKEVEREWKSVENGNVAKMVQMFKSMEDPAVWEEHIDKIEDLAVLHQQLAEGFRKTKEAGQEVSEKTYDALEKIVMDFTDEFVAEIQGDKQKALPKGKKLLNNYPALAEVLASEDPKGPKYFMSRSGQHLVGGPGIQGIFDKLKQFDLSKDEEQLVYNIHKSWGTKGNISVDQYECLLEKLAEVEERKKSA